MYLPAFYYPIQEDNRATGFLIPTYGSSTLKGQIISNAFFWAIGRSHDATHLSRLDDQGRPSARRRVSLRARPGLPRQQPLHLDQRETGDRDRAAAWPRPAAGRKSYSIGGDFSQRLPGTFSLRGSADFFSSIVTQQSYQQDLYRATNRTRRFGTFATGTLGGLQISANVDRNDYFLFRDVSCTTYGAMPRVNISRPERPIGGSPVYFGVGGEYVTLLRSDQEDDVKTTDQGLTRFDIAPTVRVPFNRWAFLGINTSLAWHGTYWTESLDTSSPQVQVNEGIARQYFDFSVRTTGPVFNRIFNPPEGQRGPEVQARHPAVGHDAVRQQHRGRVQPHRPAGGDRLGGRGVMQYTYDLTNRLYAKKDIAREVLSAVAQPDLLHRAERGEVRSAVPEQLQRPDREPGLQLLAGRRCRCGPRRAIDLQADFRAEWDPDAHVRSRPSAPTAPSRAATG